MDDPKIPSTDTSAWRGCCLIAILKGGIFLIIFLGVKLQARTNAIFLWCWAWWIFSSIFFEDGEQSRKKINILLALVLLIVGLLVQLANY